MEEAKDAGMLEPGQHRGLPSQQLGDDLPPPRLVQLVGHSLLEEEHRRLLHTVATTTLVIATTLAEYRTIASSASPAATT